MVAQSERFLGDGVAIRQWNLAFGVELNGLLDGGKIRLCSIEHCHEESKRTLFLAHLMIRMFIRHSLHRPNDDG